MLLYNKTKDINDALVPTAIYATFRRGVEHPDPVVAANVIIGLARATSYLLDRQIRALERAFTKDGGLREAMTRARLRQRNQ